LNISDMNIFNSDDPEKKTQSIHRERI